MKNKVCCCCRMHRNIPFKHLNRWQNQSPIGPTLIRIQGQSKSILLFITYISSKNFWALIKTRLSLIKNISMFVPWFVHMCNAMEVLLCFDETQNVNPSLSCFILNLKWYYSVLLGVWSMLIPTIMSIILIKSLLCFLMMNYSAENYEVSNFPLKKRLFSIELSFVLHFKIFLYVNFFQHGFLV